MGAGASVPHVFQLSALFLFYAAFPWSSESGEAGCDGEESGERAEEKGNRVENELQGQERADSKNMLTGAKRHS